MVSKPMAWRSLLEACRDGDGEALNLLLDGGADVNQVLVRAMVPLCLRDLLERNVLFHCVGGGLVWSRRTG